MNQAKIERVDDYNIEIDGLKVRADPSTEDVIRSMSQEQLDRFTKIMGRKDDAGSMESRSRRS